MSHLSPPHPPPTPGTWPQLCLPGRTEGRVGGGEGRSHFSSSSPLPARGAGQGFSPSSLTRGLLDRVDLCGCWIQSGGQGGSAWILDPASWTGRIFVDPGSSQMDRRICIDPGSSQVNVVDIRGSWTQSDEQGGSLWILDPARWTGWICVDPGSMWQDRLCCCRPHHMGGRLAMHACRQRRGEQLVHSATVDPQQRQRG